MTGGLNRLSFLPDVSGILETTMATPVKIAELTKKFGKTAKDSGSTAVQIAVLTERINELTPHFEKHTKDHSGKRGLMKLIGRRRSLLKYYSQKNPSDYQNLIGQLGIRK
jgi:small subunit ribosomal protein S15